MIFKCQLAGCLLLLGVAIGSSSSETGLESEYPYFSLVPQERMLTEDCNRVVSCGNSDLQYRRIDGTCNNFQEPLWGASEIPFVRYLAPQYEDGVGLSRGEGRTNPHPLPTPRQVSVAMSQAPVFSSNSEASLMLMQWGQFIDHDLVFTPEHEGPCCDDGLDLTNGDENCRRLDVTGDSFYSQFPINCLTFHRSLETSCLSGSREQINEVTGYLDASNVYGSTAAEEQQLRGPGGSLRIGNGFEFLTFSQNHRPITDQYTFLPSTVNSEGEEVFLAGDRRATEQPGLSSIHTLLVRTHNHLASLLRDKYPNWDSDTVYQEVRKVIAALLQHITFNEFLPVVIGGQFMANTGLSVPSPNYFYDPSLDASAPNMFATAAFRFGHSLISDIYTLRNTVVELHKSFRNHDLTLQFNQYPSDFLEAIAFSPAETMDQFMVESLTNLLFAEGPSFSHGSDLLARNIMRARDHGIPPYNDWREGCDLPRVSFSTLSNVMPSGAAAQFEAVYDDPDDIDLFPALIAESPEFGSLVGPTLQCLLGNHFYSLKYGDRFWYERNSQEGFTYDQYLAITRTSLASLICAYTETPYIQQYAMLIGSSQNPGLYCEQFVLDTIPFSFLDYW